MSEVSALFLLVGFIIGVFVGAYAVWSATTRERAPESKTPESVNPPASE